MHKVDLYCRTFLVSVCGTCGSQHLVLLCVSFNVLSSGMNQVGITVLTSVVFVVQGYCAVPR